MKVSRALGMIIAACAGFVAGMLFSEKRTRLVVQTPPVPRETRSLEKAANVSDAPPVTPPPAPVMAASQRSSPSPARDKRRSAQEFYGFVKAGAADEQTRQDFLREFLLRTDEMDEGYALYFIELLRQDPENSCALGLLLACGGPDAARFIDELLNAERVGEDVREDLLYSLIDDDDPFLPVRITVTPELEQTALRLAQSSSHDEREAAACLLGRSDSPVARTVLMRLTQEDRNEAAIRWLGRTGDRATLAWLEALPIPPDDRSRWRTLTEAIDSLRRRFPD